MAAGRLLLIFLAINLSLCTVKHWQRLASSVILIHAGVLTILIGSLLSRAGFVATVNIYEKGSSDTAFRWDGQEDLPLGFTITVKKINCDYYPSAVRVGVYINGQPTKLYELKTGESFDHDMFHVEALDLDPLSSSPTSAMTERSTLKEGIELTPALKLAITGPDGIRHVQTATEEIPTQSELAFQLVAFQTPVVKRSWVDITLIPAMLAPVSGQTEVNHPLQWQGLRFYHTATSIDTNGQAYAGIQIVKDNGIPLVYLGFFLVCLGNGIILLRQRSGNHQPRLRSAVDGDVGASSTK